MRAAVLRAAGQPVTIEEVRVRDPGPGEVRVAIRAAGLCHSDLSVIDGTIPYPTPVVLGHEGAGVVDAVGAGGALTIVGVPKIGSRLDFVVHALYQNKAILGCRYGTARPRRDFPMLADLYLGGRLKIDELITRRYALDEFNAALDDLRAGRLARGVFSLGGSAHG